MTFSDLGFPAMIANFTCLSFWMSAGHFRIVSFLEDMWEAFFGSQNPLMSCKTELLGVI